MAVTAQVMMKPGKGKKMTDMVAWCNDGYTRRIYADKMSDASTYHIIMHGEKLYPMTDYLYIGKWVYFARLSVGA